MGTFDTHGGYFAPKDYMKVNAGGSHEENPNGGVQIGVDEQGTPNLLEEGEPVYKDYVYSDNIKASERFLKDNNIPEKYAGELYSYIADKLFEEAEERPNDPISRNGLEAMLGRLADAQEAQKAYNDQRKLERELKNLSPEEMVALEQMLAEGEQQMQREQIQPQVEPEQIVPEQIVPEQVIPEQVMGCGGKINKHADGGHVNLYGGPYGTGYLQRYYRDKIAEPVAGLTQLAKDAISRGIQSAKDKVRVEKALNDLGEVVGPVPVPKYDYRIDPNAYFDDTDKKDKEIIWDRLYSPTQVGYLVPSIEYNKPSTSGRKRGPWPIDGNYYWNGPIDKQTVEDIDVSPYASVADVSEDEVLGPQLQLYGEIPETTIVASRPRISVKSSPAAVPGMSPEDIDSAYVSGRNEIFGLTLPERANLDLSGFKVYSDNDEGLVYPGDEVIDTNGNPVVMTSSEAAERELELRNRKRNSNRYLSTFPRYAGAIGAGLLGLYNAFQKPDRYSSDTGKIRPYLPYGRLTINKERYNPVDYNMLLNHNLAQGNSAVRALRNSGLGPSTAAAIIAQDANTSGNIGNTFLQAWDANNQRRNAVISANNAVDAQIAQFDYNVDAARKNILNQYQARNAQNDLLIQRLNNEAEADKYAAVGNQINSTLQALSAIGRENYVMNQVNSNPYNEGYGVLPDGNIVFGPGMWRTYTPETRKCGGSIQRKKK